MAPKRSMEQVRRILERTQVPGRHRPGPTTKRTMREPSDGLEAFQFMPVLHVDSPCVDDRENKEREFFSSLSHFGALYGLSTLQQNAFPYPLNVQYAFEDAARQLDAKDPNTKMCIVSTVNTSAAIATFRECSTEYDMYFIPIAPLLNLIHAKKRPAEINLLCSIFAYLHKILKIDFFSAEESYLYWTLTSIMDAYEATGKEPIDTQEEDDDDDDFDINQKIRDVLKEGEQLRHQILKPAHLRGFLKRVESYQPNCATGRALHLLAKEALDLYSKYPDRFMMDSIPTGLLFTQEERYHCEPFRGDQRICFIWACDGALYNVVSDYVNADLNECPGYDEPVALQVFDKPQERVTLTLEFETRAIGLIYNLIVFLTNKIWKT